MSMKDLQSEIPKIWPPIVPNPVRDMQKTMETITLRAQKDVYTPIVSKCGLGKKQGVKGIFRGMECDSYWEAAWYIYQVDIMGNNVSRNTTNAFEYTNENNEKARFYPDFKMNGIFHEIKGIFRPNDILKKEATLGLVTFWGPDEMKPILKEVYRHDPNWKTEYMEITHSTKYGKRQYN